MAINNIGWFIIGSAIIWGAVLLGCSIVLRGTDCYSQIQNILIFGTIVHLLFIWGPLAAVSRRKNTDN